ncbi:undecaprenyl-diphosphate phosphatase [Brevundimonas sp.]|uniref:undecaprenyl-diphosphate phosphatase n=1 Tax=Brevundimonas sp. TaxID=1871086 RepID=UPI001D5D0B02|nr:undecaprenyl-diphosphate phosphatase [Brevundimonas sp.]MBA4000243.1 undecaprenyl-diphosphatase [Brevundimonas sp.]
MGDWLLALLLGIVEGLTEFIPVSSTGHLLLLGHFLGFESTGKTFEVVIQLGALLAVITVYLRRLFQLATQWPHDPQARHFLIGLLVAFLPAMVIGVFMYDIIKTVFFETPVIICVSLIIGGFVLLWLDRRPMTPVHLDAAKYPMRMYLIIGVVQCLAMIPGVSRSGATIAGGLLLGADKRSAAEFSFFLALPTMGAAVAYDLFQNRAVLDFSDFGLIAIGFIAATVTAFLTVRAVLAFVTRHGFAVFAWWRILVGTVGLAGLWLTGAL